MTKPSNVIEIREQKNHQNLSESRNPNATKRKEKPFFQICIPNEDIRIVQHVIIISFFDQNIVLSLKLKIHQVVSVQCAVLYYSGLYMHICVPDTTFVMTETT